MASMSRAQQKEQALRKQREREDNKVFAQYMTGGRPGAALTTNRVAVYFAVAFVTTILPSYLFHSVRGLDFESWTALLYVLVMAGSAYLLSRAYHNMFVRTHNRVKKINDKDFAVKAGTSADEKSRIEDTKDALTQQAALGQALGITNLVYLALSLFFSFYVLSTADVRLNYVVSLPAAAAACFYLSQAKGVANKDD